MCRNSVSIIHQVIPSLNRPSLRAHGAWHWCQETKLPPFKGETELSELSVMTHRADQCKKGVHECCFRGHRVRWEGHISGICTESRTISESLESWEVGQGYSRQGHRTKAQRC